MTEPVGKKDYSKVAIVLGDCLKLRQAPFAISFTDSVPAGISEFAGRVPAGCRFWEDAAWSVNANQTLILSEATQQVENQKPPAMGRPACAVVAPVMNTGRAALSSGCCCARAYLDNLTDDMAVFAVSGAKLELYAARIEALAKANAVLATFHQIRRRDIAAGQTPTIKDSLAALQAAN